MFVKILLARQLFHMMRSVNDDLFAADAKYHKNHVSLFILLRRENQAKMTDLLYEPAFQELADDLATGIKKAKAYDMASLLLRFQESLDKRGTGSVSYTKQHVVSNSRLEKHFGDEIVFFQPSNRSKPEIVYSITVKVQDVNAWANNTPGSS